MVARRNGNAKTASSGLKLAELTAMKIEKAIADAGWPEGQLLGTEPELQDTYQVSRAVLREAIRLLEHHGVAEMRRGGSGGLVVTPPSPAAALRPTELYLQWAGVTPAQLLDARVPLELAAIRLTTDRLTDVDVERLRACVAAEENFTEEFDQSIHDLHLVLGDMSGNPVLRLFIETLTTLAHEPSGLGEFYIPGQTASRPRPIVDEVHRSHVAIADAVIAGDAALASRRMIKHLEAMTQHIQSARAGGRSVVNGKRGVARAAR